MQTKYYYSPPPYTAKMAAHALKNFNNTRHVFTAAGIEWSCLTQFGGHWPSLRKAEKNNDNLNCPKVAKQVDIEKIMDDYEVWCGKQVGRRNCPILYVLWPNATNGFI